MAEKTDSLRAEIDADLRIIWAEVQTLAEEDLATEWADATDDEAEATFRVEWGTLMRGRMVRLDHHYHGGRMTEEEEARYRSLKDKLREEMYQIEQLDLARPGAPLAE